MWETKHRARPEAPPDTSPALNGKEGQTRRSQLHTSSAARGSMWAEAGGAWMPGVGGDRGDLRAGAFLLRKPLHKRACHRLGQLQRPIKHPRVLGAEFRLEALF